jgi:peptidoglycan/xylan/chitin deacetylase (PgdA/CDA1 family)/folate-dependent phosphoribosylglycinamide formyltransferase PurN
VTVPLRVVVFTAGPLTPPRRVFIERLARDSRLALCGVVVDEYIPRRAPLALRIVRALRRDGWQWVAYKANVVARRGIGRIVRRLWSHRGPGGALGEGYGELAAATGVTVHRCRDIHDPASEQLVRAMRPQLGVLLGGRILRDAVIGIPELGTVNLHKRKVPEYRGGGPIGYWEIMAGEPAIGITVHWATAAVDAGPVLAETTIPIEEADTLDSLAIKADVIGLPLYHDTIATLASGRRPGTAQRTGTGRTFRAPSEVDVWRLERRLRRRQRRLHAADVGARTVAERVRVAVQYALLRPHLARLRRRLEAAGKAPVVILYYHVVANRRVNHMWLPLETFAAQMTYLRRHHVIVPLHAAVTQIRARVNREVVAAITFDDGYRDNRWAVAYLRFYDIPAAFFVSVGHVLDGSGFEHDRRRGYDTAHPMTAADVRALASAGFVIGSHAMHHENFGTLDPRKAEEILIDSRDHLAAITGHTPEDFSFPKGHRAVDITAETFALAAKHYRNVYSAFGGYNMPASSECQHFRRQPAPLDVVDLAMIMDGYGAGLRACLRGDGWGIKTHDLPPY